MDKMLIVAGVGKFDSRPYGALKVEGGKIVGLNTAIVFNEARACLNAGATMTIDGVHYSTAGHAECKNQWYAILHP